MVFPSSPSNGQTIILSGVTYSYDSANTAWKRVTSVGTTRIAYTASNTQPSNPTTGDLWWKIDEDIIFEYVSDGTSYHWMDITTQSFSTEVAVTVTTASSAKSFGYSLVFGA